MITDNKKSSVVLVLQSEFKPNTVCAETDHKCCTLSSLRFLIYGTSCITTFNYSVLKFEETLATQDSNFVPKDLVLLFGLKEDSIYCIFVISVESEAV